MMTWPGREKSAWAGVIKENFLEKGYHVLMVKIEGIKNDSKHLGKLWLHHQFSSTRRKSNSFFSTLHQGCRNAKVLAFFTMIFTKILISKSAAGKYSHPVEKEIKKSMNNSQKVQRCCLGHTNNKRLSQDWNPGLMPSPVFRMIELPASAVTQHKVLSF